MLTKKFIQKVIFRGSVTTRNYYYIFRPDRYGDMGIDRCPINCPDWETAEWERVWAE